MILDEDYSFFLSQEVLIFVVPKSTGTKEVIQKELENKLALYIKPKVI